jgi:tRNA 2-thiouridine synthesizing protein A
MSSGEILKMTSTDPGSVNDVTFWSKINKNYLLSHAEDGGVYTFYIQKN